MARLTGGIFSRPSGQNNGLVFGAGRTRLGKKVTVRELVRPSNPNTLAQQMQRQRFSAAIQVVRSVGRAVYQFDFNRAVAELPGFHSLQSLILNGMNEDGTELMQVNSATLGVRHFPNAFEAVGSEGDLVLTWSTETGDIGSANDQANIIVIEKENMGPDWDRDVIIDQQESRDDGTATLPIPNIGSGDYVVGIYFSTDMTGIEEDQRRSEVQWIDNT